MVRGRDRRRGPVRALGAIALVALLAACQGLAPTGSPAGPTSSASAGASASPGGSVGPSAGATTPASPVPTTVGEVIAALPNTEGVLNTVWLGTARMVAGGFAGPAFGSTIVTFADGAWSTADVPVAAGQVSAIAEFDGRLFAVGDELPDHRRGYIWESADGATWRLVHTVEDGALYDIAANDDVVVAVGALLTDEMVATAAAWSSSDGATWVPADVAGGTRTPMGTVAAVTTGFVATGDRPLGDPRPLWSSPDATSWAPVDNDLNDQYLPVDLEGSEQEWILVGASGRSGDQHPFVARSSDGGVTWDQRLLGDASEGYASAITVVDGTPYIAGVYDDALVLWTNPNAGSQGALIEPSGASIGALRWTTEWGLVGVGSRDGVHAAWALPRP